MDFRQLRYALAVAKERSFTGAAKRLHISQSAVSEQVSALEDAIGLRLFRRTGRGIEPTDTGRTFLHEAERVAGDFMNLTDTARQLRGIGMETIRIGIASGLARSILPSILSDDLIPASVQLEIRTAPTRVLFDDLSDDRLDAGVTVAVSPDRIPAGLLAADLLETQMMLIAPVDHPLAASDGPVDLAMLAEEPFIMSELSLGYGSIVGAMFDSVGIRPRIRAIVDNVETIKAAVQARAGVALVPAESAELEVQLNLLAVLPVVPSGHLTIKAYQSRQLSRRKQLLLGRIFGGRGRPTDVEDDGSVSVVEP